MRDDTGQAADVLETLALANAILVQENVLDAFGHVSMRDPADDGVFWLSKAQPPSVVRRDGFIAFGPDGEPIAATDAPLFVERHIHAAIYAARPDVGAVCHHHAMAVMPFCIGKEPFVPVSQNGAFLGGPVPVWDSAEEFGATAMLIDSAEQARSLAACLGQHAMVLMRGHGATVVGAGLGEVVYKAVYACREAQLVASARTLGTIVPLSEAEIAMAGPVNANQIARCWEHLVHRYRSARHDHSGEIGR